MGFCLSCSSRGPTENKIREAWEESHLTNLSAEEYLLKIIDFSKTENFTQAENQENFYNSIFKANESSNFFEFLKNDIMFLVNNKQFQFQILTCFVFFTKSKNAENLKNNFDLVAKQIAENFKIELPLEENVDLFKEIIHTYITISSKFSLDAVMKMQPDLIGNSSKNDKAENSICNAFDQGNIMLFIKNLFNFENFSITKFIELNYQYLNHNNLREELLILFTKNNPDKSIGIAGKIDAQINEQKENNNQQLNNGEKQNNNEEVNNDNQEKNQEIENKEE